MSRNDTEILIVLHILLKGNEKRYNTAFECLQFNKLNLKYEFMVFEYLWNCRNTLLRGRKKRYHLYF